MDCPICASPALALPDWHPQCQLYRCTVCGHKFSQLNANATMEPYDPAYFGDTHYNWFANPLLTLYAQIAKVIARDPTIKDVIDVGCGNGNFLRFLSEHTSADIRLTGVDLFENASTSKIEYIKSDIFSIDIARQYSAVVTLATIEHIDNIRLFAHHLKSLVRPGGLLVVMTLNDDSFLYIAARLLHRIGFSTPFNRLYSRHHLHHFTRKSLARLLENENFHVESTVLHNAPLGSLDIPASSAATALIQRLGVRVLFALGWIFRRTYLQTVICRAV